MWWRGAAPGPRLRMTIELGSGDAGGVGDVGGIRQRHAGEGLAAENAPTPSIRLSQAAPTGMNACCTRG